MASSEGQTTPKLGLGGAWAMAVGGMVGGGIFSALGVVLEIAGPWAPLSFLLAGIVALVTAVNYARLARAFGEGGGAFTFLREMKRDAAAGALSWVLLMGYTLTIGVYAFTFGHYLAHTLGLGGATSRLAGVGIVVALVGLNILGVGHAAWFEIVSVWGKLIILFGLAALGLFRGSTERLFEASAGAPGGFVPAIAGAAAIFMAYEGFQLLAYDYEDLRDPDRTLLRAVLLAVTLVILLYLLVTVGSVMLIGADQIIEHKEISLAIVGTSALGHSGMVLAGVAAVLSTGSAINATLFATARLAKRVAEDGELPRLFAWENVRGLPVGSIIAIGLGGATLAAVGSLTRLVEAASLAFLVTFAIVNALGALELKTGRGLAWGGCLIAGGAAVALALRLATEAWWVLGVLSVIVVAAFALRPLVHRSNGRHRVG
ncbi:MAG: APC family permease [Phycisphaerales bacterium JB059]